MYTCIQPLFLSILDLHVGVQMFTPARYNSLRANPLIIYLHSSVNWFYLST